MNHNMLIPQNILQSGEAFFNGQFVMQAKRILETARINVSFQKGNTERYFIISGIINDGEQRKSKISFKKEDNNVSSSCTCTQWSEEGHCPHTAALFYKFHLNQALKEELGEQQDGPLRPELALQGHGVHAKDYGRIVPAPSKLEGARSNSTYSSLQYLLTNRKVVHFPLAKDFRGKLRMDLVPASTLADYENFPNIENKFFPLFSMVDEQGEVKKKISLFESLYIFNWDNGEAFNISSTTRELIKNIQREGFLRPINDFLKLLTPFMDTEGIEILLRHKPISELEFRDVNFRCKINRSQKRSFLDFDIEFFDSEERIAPPPPQFKLMCSEGGHLDGFRSKNDSYEFVNSLMMSLKFENQNYKKALYSASTRQKILEDLDFALNEDEILFANDKVDALYRLSTKKFLAILTSFFESFGENSARFSYFLPEEKRVYFQVPKNQLLQGVSKFHKALTPFGVVIFYNQNEIKTWSSNIRFERKQSNLDWFEVNLVMDENDLQVIKNAEFSDDFLVTDQGLILLDAKEKELLKFMKKYTKHEAQDGAQQKTGAENKFSLSLNRSRIFELFELKKHGIEGALTQEEEAICQRLLNMESMPEYPLPDNLKDIARPYQATGYNWMRFLYENKFGACLADDMGLGKTLQTIMFLQSVVDKVDRVLVVCPVSILINWQNEIAKFSDMDVHCYYGVDREKPTEDTKIILTSYGVMKKEAYTTFADMKFDILIMDEVQHLKNIRSQGATAARTLKANFRICLTGTPVENDLSEFYNIMDLSIPGIWGELSFFRSSSNKKSRLLARQTVRPFILRRTKEQVLTELPEKEENHVYLNFTDEEREHYLSTLVNIKKRMETAQKGRKYSEILKSLLQLRQLCLWQKTQSIRSSKVDFLMENLEVLMEEGHKVLVFSQFTTYLDIIQNKVRERSYNYARIDGSQSLKKRQAEVERFQEGDAQVFLISLKAGGVGLNLTAASYIFLMDPWWNPAVENQAIDRAYRIGQENKLTVYRPIIKDSVEEKVLVLQNSKRELFKDLMASDEDSFFNGKLNMDDFQALLE
ncbi:MAG: DEAD/DEAH box helicase [Bacteriovoracaceae bacterium]|nr:DEAD/DEAH box helicase [Bacteriovoracaceae bacterium]